jgi:hypothetical protein
MLKKIGCIVPTSESKNCKTFTVNQEFPYFPELHALFQKSSLYPYAQSLDKIRTIGDVKLAFISGVFLSAKKSKADLLIIGDDISRVRLKNMIKNLEAEIGKEIRFVLLGYGEFRYRMDMLDRFVTEFFSGPYEEVLNRVPDLQRLMSGLRR